MTNINIKKCSTDYIQNEDRLESHYEKTNKDVTSIWNYYVLINK